MLIKWVELCIKELHNRNVPTMAIPANVSTMTKVTVSTMYGMLSFFITVSMFIVVNGVIPIYICLIAAIVGYNSPITIHIKAKSLSREMLGMG